MQYATIDVPNNATTTYEINLADYEFGWEIEQYRSVDAKLAYLLLCLRDFDHPDKEAGSARVYKVFREHTGLDLVVAPSSEESWDNGYIDHESVNLPWSDGVLQDEQSIKDFVFGPDSYIQTDNDNH